MQCVAGGTARSTSLHRCHSLPACIACPPVQQHVFEAAPAEPKASQQHTGGVLPLLAAAAAMRLAAARAAAATRSVWPAGGAGGAGGGCRGKFRVAAGQEDDRVRPSTRMTWAAVTAAACRPMQRTEPGTAAVARCGRAARWRPACGGWREGGPSVLQVIQGALHQSPAADSQVASGPHHIPTKELKPHATRSTRRSTTNAFGRRARPNTRHNTKLIAFSGLLQSITSLVYKPGLSQAAGYTRRSRPAIPQCCGFRNLT